MNQLTYLFFDTLIRSLQPIRHSASFIRVGNTLYDSRCTRQTGKVRLAKWFQTLPSKQKAKIVKDVTQLVLARRTRMCNFLEYKGTLVSRTSYTFLHFTRFSPKELAPVVKRSVLGVRNEPRLMRQTRKSFTDVTPRSSSSAPSRPATMS